MSDTGPDTPSDGSGFVLPPFGPSYDATLDEYWREIEEQNDRGMAVLAAAYLEWRIRESLKVHFPVWDGRLEQVFGSDDSPGKLGALDRARVAYGFGLIGPIQLSDIQWIAEIRNKFAHHSGVRSFGHPEVVKRVDKIRTPDARADHMERMLKGVVGVGPVHRPTSPREKYSHAVHEIATSVWIVAAIFAEWRAGQESPPSHDGYRTW